MVGYRKRMKKKMWTLLKIIMVIILVLIIGDFILDARWKPLGNMKKNVQEADSYSSSFSFQGNEGMRVRVDIKTEIENGTITFVLNDSNGNIVKQFPKAKELVAYVVFDYDDTYTLTMTCSEFVGKYSGKVSIKRY